MSFTEDEKTLLRNLVKKEMEVFQTEGKTIVVDDNPGFEALEEKYEEFLENLLKKI